MATQGVLGAATLKEFEDGLHGELIRPGDGAYDEARSIWNGAHDARPAVIARCADSSDVRHAIGFARSEGLDVAVRGGSHSIPGFSTCDDGIVIDLSPMKGITVDVSGRTATAEGGVTWGEFDAATQEHGLATTGGLVSTTGVAGFTLGGGIGWLMRKHGLACDNLRSAEVVTADGQILTASATENPDLFWGLRGGGGNFGIVTSFEFDLHPVGPTVAAGPVFYPGDRAKEVMRFYREFTRDLPDELTHPGQPDHRATRPVPARGLARQEAHRPGRLLLRRPRGGDEGAAADPRPGRPRRRPGRPDALRADAEPVRRALAEGHPGLHEGGLLPRARRPRDRDDGPLPSERDLPVLGDPHPALRRRDRPCRRGRDRLRRAPGAVRAQRDRRHPRAGPGWRPTSIGPSGSTPRSSRR